MNYNLFYQGSVKNLFEGQDDILFEYSDRYSLFDWGEMPDHLEKKGEALAVMGALFFAEVEKHNIPHHFLALSDKSGHKLDWTPTPYLKVKKVSVTRPAKTESGYDYSFYQTRPQEGLVPLEVMFRFGAGSGSSLIKRAAATPALLEQWNLSKLEEGKLWDLPLIDFSTKLEKGDRYLTHQEAQEVAGLNSQEFSLLIDQTIKVAMVLRNIFTQMGLELWDGKLEWAFNLGENRSFMLVDSIGLDELRLQKNGKSLSKEFLREYYRSTPWYHTLTTAKSIADRTGQDFKKLCNQEPPHLPAPEKELATSLYLAFTNDLAQLVIGQTIFNPKFTLSNWKGWA
ncbi:MAG: phosphoribosylaminoimidazole succinocarboxamide synthase [Bdellovibrionales bacterium]|nr:phosphoribosylaminoimidazole succinocarboxamide synthase [Bdellovibrionales bacterium]